MSLVPGAGATPEQGHDVTGVVSYQGKPLPRGIVNFMRGNDRPRGGPIGPDGGYACQLPPGAYQVTVTLGVDLPLDFKKGDPLPKPTDGSARQIRQPQDLGHFANRRRRQHFRHQNELIFWL